MSSLFLPHFKTGVKWIHKYVVVWVFFSLVGWSFFK